LENQGQKNRINPDWLAFAMLTVLGAWILDVLSTWIGVGFFGLFELNPLFFQFPWVWLALFEAWILFAAYFERVPLKIRKIMIGSIMLGSFYPGLSNMLTMWRALLG
jgi:hypothetical protein